MKMSPDEEIVQNVSDSKTKGENKYASQKGYIQ